MSRNERTERGKDKTRAEREVGREATNCILQLYHRSADSQSLRMLIAQLGTE